MTVRERVSDYRRKMRESGFRPVQFWVPDVRTERFLAEAHRESLAVAAADRRGDDQEFIEAVSAPWDDE
jgi:hypothetical protein